MKSQRGVAAVTALLIVAVAASAAALMLAQQSAMIDQTTMVASRSQAELYAQAGIDWARGILAEDAQRAGNVDSLDEGWAQPIVGLPVERAVVAGAIADEQGKFNLNNLVNGTQKSARDLEAFKRLLQTLGLAPELADATLDWIDPDGDLTSGAGAEDAYYLSLAKPYRAANQPMVQVEELYRVRGFDAATVAKLRPHVTALPERTSVNVNTADEMVLGAILPELSAAEISQLVRVRQVKPFRAKAEIGQAARKAPAETINASLDVRSSYFTVRVQVAQDDVHVATEALIHRETNAPPALLWRRARY